MTDSCAHRLHAVQKQALDMVVLQQKTALEGVELSFLLRGDAATIYKDGEQHSLTLPPEPTGPTPVVTVEVPAARLMLAKPDPSAGPSFQDAFW